MGNSYKYVLQTMDMHYTLEIIKCAFVCYPGVFL